MKKLLLCVLAVLWIVGLSASSAPAQPVELKAVSFLPKDHRLCAMIPVWIEKVNTELKDCRQDQLAGRTRSDAGF